MWLDSIQQRVHYCSIRFKLGHAINYCKSSQLSVFVSKNLYRIWRKNVSRFRKFLESV